MNAKPGNVIIVPNGKLAFLILQDMSLVNLINGKPFPSRLEDFMSPLMKEKWELCESYVAAIGRFLELTKK